MKLDANLIKLKEKEKELTTNWNREKNVNKDIKTIQEKLEKAKFDLDTS